MNDESNNNDTDEVYPPAIVPWQNPGWNSEASDLKGETPELVEHLKNIYERNDNTSVDAPWWVHRNWGITDIYTVLIMVVALLPMMVVLWIPMFLCLLVPVALNRLYMSYTVPHPCDVVPRTYLFHLHCLIQFILCLPAMFLAAFILAYSLSAMTFFGTLYLIPSSTFRCRPFTERLFHNQQVLKPYLGGPSLMWHFEDIVIAVMGSVYRQHFFEFMISFTNMFFINPWWKYWVTANIYLNDLGERFLTQIGQSLADMTIHDIETQARKAISRSKNTPTNRNEIDNKTFAPHYPYPPGNRRYAIGMQTFQTSCNLVHTTHFRSPVIGMEGDICSLSHSAALPLYRVMLWRNNPYHIGTGYVEANVSTGLPTQPKKLHGGEHPMWLVNSHNKLAADRNVSWSLGNIDNFFDDFIPQMNHFIRLNVRGRDIADEYLAKDRRLGYEAFKYQKMAEV